MGKFVFCSLGRSRAAGLANAWAIAKVCGEGPAFVGNVARRNGARLLIGTLGKGAADCRGNQGVSASLAATRRNRAALPQPQMDRRPFGRRKISLPLGAFRSAALFGTLIAW